MADFNFLRTLPVDLSRYLPDFLYDEDGFSRVQKALGDEHEKQRRWTMETEKQFFVNTATWGLTNWEEFVGIRTDMSRDIALRRRDILVKLEPPASVTPDWLRSLADRFISKPSAVVVPHNEEYWFEVLFDLDDLLSWSDLKAAIDLYKPAHLGLDIILGIILSIPIRHTALCMSYVDAHHNPWNLGIVDTFIWDGTRQWDGMPTWSGLIPDMLYRDRQHHLMSTEMIVDLTQNGAPRHVSLATLSFATVHDVPIRHAFTGISLDGVTLPIQPAHQGYGVELDTSPQPRSTSTPRNRMDGASAIWDGMHAFDGLYEADTHTDNLCTCYSIDAAGNKKERSFTRL